VSAPVGGTARRRLLPRFRATLGVKLALVLFGVVAGALAIVYLMVVPRLESRLVDAKIRQLERPPAPLLVSHVGESAGDGVALRDAVDVASANLNARVVVFRRIGEGDLLLHADSSAVAERDITEDPVVLEASATLRPAEGRVRREDREFAEVAVPVGPDLVVLISASLDDALANVRLVRGSVVVAGLVALLVAAAAAYGAALGLTRRLRRLETAADRIAAGDFGAPVDVGGSDEIAQLGRAFDSMRIRLADLDRVRREFIANASHELRTPLFSLGGFLELLDDDDVDPDTRREFLAETRAQVDRLSRLASDLLDLSRLDAGQLRVERRPIELASVARAVAEEFRLVAGAADHPLRVAGDGEVHAVGDRERIVRIGRILVENSLRHTPAGTPIEVTAERRDGKGALAVRDEGPGIPAEEQEHVFERFYRAPGGKASGSGLGLAIASELASRMGGRLGVASKPGETVFTLELPGADPPFSRENGPAKEADVGGSRDTSLV
jgi:two-component system, OmpR family, sensor kinase